MRPAPKSFHVDYPFESDEMAADRQTASLAGLALMLALVVVSLLLVHRLHHEAQVEDCLISGRTDCVGVVMTTQYGRGSIINLR
jgi:hypothetical protein